MKKPDVTRMRACVTRMRKYHFDWHKKVILEDFEQLNDSASYITRNNRVFLVRLYDNHLTLGNLCLPLLFHCISYYSWCGIDFFGDKKCRYDPQTKIPKVSWKPSVNRKWFFEHHNYNLKQFPKDLWDKMSNFEPWHHLVQKLNRRRSMGECNRLPKVNQMFSTIATLCLFELIWFYLT